MIHTLIKQPNKILSLCNKCARKKSKSKFEKIKKLNKLTDSDDKHKFKMYTIIMLFYWFDWNNYYYVSMYIIYRPVFHYYNFYKNIHYTFVKYHMYFEF